MADDNNNDEGGASTALPATEFEAAYADHVKEVVATRFLATPNGPMVRIAFGVFGYQLEGREPVSKFEVAISLTDQTAKEIRDLLIAVYPLSPQTETGE